jgi:hypothetical protein
MLYILSLLPLLLSQSVSALTKEDRIAAHIANQLKLYEATIDCSLQKQNIWEEFTSAINRPTYDVVITCAGGTKLCAHSGFLVAQSKYFVDKVKEARIKAPTVRIVQVALNGHSAAVMRVLIQYMYTGEATIPGKSCAL